jgi:phosphatidylglycerophosphate synthase
MTSILYTDPIERMTYKLAAYVSDFFYKTGHCPNMITTYSVMFKVVSIMTLWYGFGLTFCIAYFIAFMFDCLDGFMARKYNMYSNIGDMYDHLSDNITFIAIILVVCYKLRDRRYTLYVLLCIITILGLLNIAHVACISKQNKKSGNSPGVLDGIQGMCITGNPFGTGMFSLLVPITIACVV